MSSVSVLLLVVATAAVTPALSASLPSYWKACKRSGPDVSLCLVKTLQDAIPSLIKGDKVLDIPILDPFEVEEVVVSDKKSGGKALNIDLKFKKVRVEGVKDVTFGLDSKIDLEKKKLTLRATVPSLKVEGLYTIEGKVLLLPIQGKGDAKLTLEDADVTYVADLTFHKGPDGKDYIQLVDPKLDFQPKHFGIHLNNLFNGDKTLGDTMNAFLNENWREVLVEFGPAVKETVSNLVYLLINNVIKNVPYDEIFPQ